MLFILFAGIVYFSGLPAAFAQTPQTYQAPEVKLLPNNSFYKLQLVWDKLSLLFTKDSAKRALKYIELADRELTGAAKVIQLGDNAVGLHSAFRGEHYMTQFVNEIKRMADESGSLDTIIIKPAHDAYPYHQQLLIGVIGKTSADTQTDLQKILEFSQRNETELKNLELEFSTPKPQEE